MSSAAATNITHNIPIQIGSFHWWEGVVEDNLDPKGAGRCRVRVIAHTSESKDDIPTEKLPWAYPVMPLNNPHGKIVALKPGTRVFGFFRDGTIGNDYTMLGTINTGYEDPGSPENFNEEVGPVDKINVASNVSRIGDQGFIDDRAGAGGPIAGQPQKTKVSSDMSHENISDYGPLETNEMNTPRLARGIIEGTISEAHAAGLASVTKASGGDVPEPDNPYGAQYPFNTVEESDSGHFREMDDTPDAERIKESHRTGTFYEIHPDGTKVTKVVKDNYSVTLGDDAVKIEGICAVHVVGQSDFYCESDIRVLTDQNAHVEAKLNADVKAGVNATVEAGVNATVEAGADAKVTAGAAATVEGASSTTVTSGGPLKIVGGGNVDIAAAGFITFADESATASDVARIIKDRT